MAANDSQPIRQVLENASASGEAKKATFYLKGKEGQQAPSPEETARTARSLVERAASSAGGQPDKLNILENLGSFVVQGKPGLLLHLLDQPEVAYARINQPDQPNMMQPIRPVKTREENSEGWA